MDEEDPSDFAEKLAAEMLPYHKRDRLELLQAPYLFWSYSPDEIDDLLTNFFTVRNMKIDVVSSNYRPSSDGDKSDDEDDEDDDDIDDDDEDDDDEEEEEETEDDGSEETGNHVKVTDETVENMYTGPTELLSYVLSPTNLHFTEPNFSTKYWELDISNSLYSYFEKSSSAHDGLYHLPNKNPFISNLNLQMVEVDSESIPEKIKIADGITLWFMSDITFSSPKVEIFYNLVSPCITTADTSCLLDLFCKLLREKLNEDIYVASTASINCNISTSEMGLQIKISGYSDNAPKLFERILDCITELSNPTTNVIDFFTSSCIQIQFEQLIKFYENSLLKSSHVATNARVLSLLPNKFGSDEKLLFTASLINNSVLLEQSLINFIQSFLNTLYVESFFQGNILKDHAIQLFTELHNKHEYSKYSSNNYPTRSVTNLPINDTIILNQHPKNVNEKNCCVEIYYQLQEFELEVYTQLEVLDQLLTQPFFDNLRTKKQVYFHSFCV